VLFLGHATTPEHISRCPHGVAQITVLRFKNELAESDVGKTVDVNGTPRVVAGWGGEVALNVMRDGTFMGDGETEGSAL